MSAAIALLADRAVGQGFELCFQSIDSAVGPVAVSECQETVAGSAHVAEVESGARLSSPQQLRKLDEIEPEKSSSRFRL